MKLRVSIEMDIEFSDEEVYLDDLEDNCHDILSDLMAESYSAERLDISIIIER